MISSSRLLLRYETRLVVAPRPSSATKPPSSGLRRPSACSAPSPTFAHGPRGQQASTPWPSGVPVGDVGQRRPQWAATGGLGVGTTLPGHRARAAGTVAKTGTVCLRAKKTYIGLGAIVGGVFGRFYARRCPVATGANVGDGGPVVAQRKAVAGRGDNRPPQQSCGNGPAWHSTNEIITDGRCKVKRRRRT